MLNRTVVKTTSSIFLGCAVLLMAALSCSRELPADRDPYDGPFTTSFMSVNLVFADDADDTRAAGDVHETGDGTYVTGYPNENAIQSVRFYFFKADGTAANVKHVSNNTMANYLDWNSSDPGWPGVSDPAAPGDDVTNVEKKVNARLIINTREGDELPFQIVAVVNPPADMPDVASVKDLNAITRDYSIAAAADRFVMSNSVYVGYDGKEAEAVPVVGRMFDSDETAMHNPVTIYVERVNAKAVLSCKQLPPVPGRKNVFDTGVRIDDLADKKLSPGKIYVEFLGWDVTQAAGKSWLMKHIDERWKDADLFGVSSSLRWNIPGRYRSFWAVNPVLRAPKTEDSDYVFKSFNEHREAVTDFGTGTDETAGNYLYIQENAAKDASSACAYPTQFIIAARLVDEQGAPLTLAEYGFLQYTFDGLKKAMADKAKVYKKDPAFTEGTRFVKIDADDIVLLSATEAGQAGPETEGRYYVYAAIKGTANADDKDGEAFTSTATTGGYYTDNSASAQPAAYAAVNARLLADCGHAKLWDRGQTYYYADIRHLGAENSMAWKGIVRNHIYALDINALAGLGTPVYRPDEVIYPEKPDPDETYIGAEVKVLAWRLVNQDVSFAW